MSTFSCNVDAYSGYSPDPLYSVRINGYLEDTDGPWTSFKFSVEHNLSTPEQTDRAVAELHGFSAAWEHIKGLRKSGISTNDGILDVMIERTDTLELEVDEEILADLPPVAIETQEHCASLITKLDRPEGLMSPKSSCDYHNEPAPKSPDGVSQTTCTEEADTESRLQSQTLPRAQVIEEVVRSVFKIEDRSKKDFARFREVTGAPDAPKILQRLTVSADGDRESCFPDADAWLTRGFEVHEKITRSTKPDTLPDILAFTSLSFVISTIQVDRGHINKDKVLCDLYYYRDAIRNQEDRAAFVGLVEKIWLFKLDSGRRESLYKTPRGSGTIRLSDNALQDNAFYLTLHQSQYEAEYADFYLNLHQSQYEAEYADFCQDSTAMRSKMNMRHAPNIDPHQLVPSQFMEFEYSELDQCALISPLSMVPAPEPSYVPQQRPPSHVRYKFEISEKQCLDPQLDLRNTVIYLVVLAFLKQHGDFYCRLSGLGRTATASRNWESSVESKRKAAKELGKKFFKPLNKEAKMKKNDKPWARFHGCIGMAKYLARRGHLQTQAEVLDYLVIASQKDQARFQRWITLDVPRDDMQHSSGNPSKREDVPSDADEFPEPKRARVTSNFRSDPPAATTRPSEEGVERLYRCLAPKCGRDFESASGLSKHKMKHFGRTIPCRFPGCNYESHRPDQTRKHFRKKHSGQTLPPHLEEGVRGPTVRRQT
ncbi:hypothetical protein QBC44DRAFT_363421 [Cladorrhinum sp. PSN332]|nr:hypothetical protein QBC44DRAFT_363421 [Cladorrhinum sp. PSN332]